MNSPARSFKNVNRQSTFESLLFMTIGILLAHQSELTTYLATHMDVPVDIVAGAVAFVFYVLRKIIMPTSSSITKETTVTATTTSSDPLSSK